MRVCIREGGIGGIVMVYLWVCGNDQQYMLVWVYGIEWLGW